MSLINVSPFLYPGSSSMTPTGGFTLDAAEELITFIVSAPKTGTLKKIGWRVYSVSSPLLTCRVSIETVADAVGAPVATTDADKTLYAANAISADIENPSAGVRFDAINGTTGISVTKGDMLAITIRVIALTSGSIVVHFNQYVGLVPMTGISTNQRTNYTASYAAGAWALYSTPLLTLEYTNEFVPTLFTHPTSLSLASLAWSSASNPDRRGIKFRLPYGCAAKGMLVYVDADVDIDLILYDSDDYTVKTGFPVTIDKDNRSANTTGYFYLEFSTEPEFLADTWYRAVLLPKDTTNITAGTIAPTADDTILGLTAFPEGVNVIYTAFNGAPSSGSHDWSGGDDNTKRMIMNLVINKIDIPSGGGRPELRGANL